MASAVSLVGILSIWAALSRRHWFVRTAVVGGLLGLLAIVPAYDLVLIFLAQAVAIVVAFTVGRWWKSRTVNRQVGSRRRWSFRLVDLFLLTAVIAVLTLLARGVADTVDSFVKLAIYTEWGVCCAAGVLAGFCATLERRLWLKPILFAFLPLAAATVPAYLLVLSDDGPYSAGNFQGFLGDWECPEWIWYPAFLLVAGTVASWILLYKAAALFPELPQPFKVAPQPQGRRLRLLARPAVTVLSLAILVLPAVAYFEMVVLPPIPPSKLPNPNGYVELKRVGQELLKLDPPETASANEATLRALTLQSAEQLNVARNAFRYDSLVPVNYDRLDLDLSLLSEFRALTLCWDAKGRVAEIDLRYDDACDTYLDLCRAAAQSAEGGLLVHRFLSLVFCHS
jgi:hypothetical protein